MEINLLVRYLQLQPFQSNQWRRPTFFLKWFLDSVNAAIYGDFYLNHYPNGVPDVVIQCQKSLLSQDLFSSLSRVSLHIVTGSFTFLFQSAASSPLFISSHTFEVKCSVSHSMLTYPPCSDICSYFSIILPYAHLISYLTTSMF